MIIPYIMKYSKIYVSLTKYKFTKLLGIDLFKLHEKKIMKSTKDKKRFKKYLKENMNKSLIYDSLDDLKIEMKNDNEFITSLKKQSDLTLSNNFLVLGNYVNNIYDHSSRSYQWHYDFNAQYNYKLTHYSRVRKVNNKKGVDIKNVWEVSRMQYLLAPSLYWKLTGDERYAKFVVKVIDDWINQNKYQEGPNWNISMEVGIRISNILLAFQVIFDSESVDDQFAVKVYTSAYQHLKFILKNEENIAGRTSNHYLGGILGITAVVTTFPSLDKKGKIIKYVDEAAHHEINKQIFPDGVSFEGSTSYQRLVGEMFSFLAIMLKNANIELSKTYIKKLNKMAYFTQSITKPNGEIVQIGDNDGGRVFVLTKDNNLNHMQFINLAHFLSTGTTLNNEYEYWNMIFIGNPPTKSSIPLIKYNITFPDSKIAVVKSEELFFLISSIDSHEYDMGGHTHNDKLSFELCYKGENFIVDPGTAVYTSDPALRNKMRSVASHSTVMINNSEQNRFKSNSLFDSLYDCKTSLEMTENNGEVLISGEIFQTHNNNLITHSRKVKIGKSKINITDKIMGGFSALTHYFVLDPEVVIDVNNHIITLRNNGAEIQIKTTSATNINVIEGYYSPTYGEWIRNSIIEINAERFNKDYEEKFEILLN